MLQDGYITLAQTLTIVSRRGHLFRSILFQNLKKYRGQLMELNGIWARVILLLFSSSVQGGPRTSLLNPRLFTLAQILASQCVGDIPYNKKNLILIFLLGRLWWARQSEKTLSWQ